ncbi:MAG: energy transducer TonB [Hyphomicrobiaceae bacterium]|nr:MAG: energy transducer TonB [Hyphomicrobiaceae bacterium]
MMPAAAQILESPRTRLLRWASAATVVLAAHLGGAALALMHWQDDAAADRAGAVMIELAPVAAASPIDMPDVAHGPLMEEAKLTPQASKRTTQEVEKETPPVEQSPAPDPEVAMPVPKPVKEEKPEEEEEKKKEEVAEQPTPAQTTAAPLTMAPPRIDAKPSTIAVAPAPGSTINATQARIAWEKALNSHLNRYKRYPDGARARGVQGMVNVAFMIDRSGQVISSHVVQSSGSPLLDEEALAVLRRASPLPSPPEHLFAGAALNLALPIQFRIR